MNEPTAPTGTSVQVGSTDATAAADLWSAVVGQDVAVGRLRAAATDPSHAYLLVGPEGTGTREAARAFAASLLGGDGAGDDAADVRRKVAAEAHPCLTVVERVGATISAEQVGEVVRQASMAPPSGDRQVIVLVDLHLSLDNAPRLLKTLEEPPSSTVFVVLAETVPAEMSTVASRCVLVEFGPVPPTVIRDRLIAEGVDADAADIAAAGSGGSLTQARLLGADPSAASRRALWSTVPERLDGTGATAASLVDEVMARTDELVVPLLERQAAELVDFDERAAVSRGGMSGERKAMIERHRREQRRVRNADLRAGLAALVGRYRDALADGRDPEDFLAAADAVQEVVERLVFNPNDVLQLQALFVRLPSLREGR